VDLPEALGRVKADLRAVEGAVTEEPLECREGAPGGDEQGGGGMAKAMGA